MKENKEIETITNEEQPVQEQPTVQSVEPNNNDKKGNNKKLITIILIIVAGLCVIFAVVFFVFFNHSDKDDEDYNDEPEVVEKEDEDKKETTDDETKKEEKNSDEEKQNKEREAQYEEYYKKTCKESKFQVNSIEDAKKNGYYVVTADNVKNDADKVAFGSLEHCCNLYKYNFDDINKVPIAALIDYAFSGEGLYLEKNIKTSILDQIIYERYGIENISKNIKSDQVIFSDSDHICTGGPGGGTDGPYEYKLKTSNSTNNNNIYTYNYTYEYYMDNEYKYDVNVTVKYRYDANSKLYKLFYLNNTDPVKRERKY